MIAMQSFEVLKILNSFEIKSDRISAECGLGGEKPHRGEKPGFYEFLVG
jgi:hypothetical protein